MRNQETNIFLIKNLGELNCKYNLYGVRGLTNSVDYYKNQQLLVNKLRYKTHSPIQPILSNNKFYIAQLEGYGDLPNTEMLVRDSVKIEKMSSLKELKFDSLKYSDYPLAKKFLEWQIQNKFYNKSSLWQPSAGFPFYNKTPNPSFKNHTKNIDLFNGFSNRVVILKNNKIGICIDVSSKYVSSKYLPTDLTNDTFNKYYRGKKCVYEYGKNWYEIKLSYLNDLKANEIDLPNNMSLYDDIFSKAGVKKSPELLSLPKDSSVIKYFNKVNQIRNAPSGLCRLTYGTEHPDIRKLHSFTIKSPDKRRNEIKSVVEHNFSDLRFANNLIDVSEKPYIVEKKIFFLPDLEFGNKKILSTQNTINSIKANKNNYGMKKKELLYSKEAGFFNQNKEFDRQYLILPNSISNTYGPQFIRDLKRGFQEIYANGKSFSYNPEVIYYNDSVQPGIYRLGREIINAVEENSIPFGFGLVMIPKLKEGYSNKEDILSNLLMKKLRDRELFVSIIHKKMLELSYNLSQDELGNIKANLTTNSRQKGRYRGYLKNVIMNKILITNNYKPFILKTPLIADLIIGIDVKNDTAGFTVINKNSNIISFEPSESHSKEQLGKNEVRTRIFNIISKEPEFENIKNLVIHRQGKLFPLEKDGINMALRQLSNSNLIHRDYQCTFVDIRATSRIPYRQFDVNINESNGEVNIRNPRVGSYSILTDNEGYICNTGLPYKYKGSTNPLHIIKDGPISIKHVLKDVFNLSNLTWTKVDSCLRLPLSIKLNDIRLKEIAGKFDQDALIYTEEV